MEEKQTKRTKRAAAAERTSKALAAERKGVGRPRGNKVASGAATPATGDGRRRKKAEVNVWALESENQETIQQRKEGYMRQLREAVTKAETPGQLPETIVVPRLFADLKKHFSPEELMEIESLRNRVAGRKTGMDIREVDINRDHSEGADISREVFANSFENAIAQQPTSPAIQTAADELTAPAAGMQEHLHTGSTEGETTGPVEEEERAPRKSILDYLSTPEEKRIFSADFTREILQGTYETASVQEAVEREIDRLLAPTMLKPALIAYTFQRLIGLQAFIFGEGNDVVAVDVLSMSDPTQVSFENIGRLVVQVDHDTREIKCLLHNYTALVQLIPVEVEAPSALAVAMLVRSLMGSAAVITHSKGEPKGSTIIDFHLPDISFGIQEGEHRWVSVLDDGADTEVAEAREFKVFFASSKEVFPPAGRKDVDVQTVRTYGISAIFYLAKAIRNYLYEGRIDDTEDLVS